MEGRALKSFVNPAYNLKFPYKIFVKEQEIKNEDSNSVEKIANASKEILTGTEAKDFYETVICENPVIDNAITDDNDSNINIDYDVVSKYCLHKKYTLWDSFADVCATRSVIIGS